MRHDKNCSKWPLHTYKGLDHRDYLVWESTAHLFSLTSLSLAYVVCGEVTFSVMSVCIRQSVYLSIRVPLWPQRNLLKNRSLYNMDLFKHVHLRPSGGEGRKSQNSTGVTKLNFQISVSIFCLQFCFVYVNITHGLTTVEFRYNLHMDAMTIGV